MLALCTSGLKLSPLLLFDILRHFEIKSNGPHAYSIRNEPKTVASKICDDKSSHPESSPLWRIMSLFTFGASFTVLYNRTVGSVC